MPWRLQNNPSNIEKIIAGISYFTAGIAGIIYIILSRSRAQSYFFRFHFLQSIILCIVQLLINWGSDIFITLCGGLLALLNPILPNAQIVGIQVLSVGIKGISLIVFILMAYGAVFSFLGKYAEIPGISNIVRQQMR